jgi:hypothetical protein
MESRILRLGLVVDVKKRQIESWILELAGWFHVAKTKEM